MRWVKLEECCTIQGGATPKRNVDTYWGKGLDWFTPKDLSSLKTKKIGRAPEQVTNEGLNSCSAKLIPANSLLLSSRAPIGHLAITSQDCCTNQGFQNLIPNQGSVDVNYLYYVMKWSVPRLQDMGRGATFKEISKAIVKEFQIPLPPLEEQRRIAGILDEADLVRKKTQALIDKYDELAQSLFLDMFGDPVTNPKGWEVVKLAECCAVQGGATPKRDVKAYWGQGLDWFTPKDLSSLNTIEIGRAPEQITPEGLSSCSAKLIPANSLLLSSRAPIGHMAITTHDCCTNQGFQSLVPKVDKVNVQYLYHLLKIKMPQLVALGRGATFKEVSKAIVSGFEIPLPHLSLQADFEVKMKHLTLQKNAMIESGTLAETNFNALLQIAFNSQLQ